MLLAIVVLVAVLDRINAQFSQYPGGSGNTCSYMGPVVTHRLMDIAIGPGGNLWVTDAFGNEIDRITLNGRVTRFALPTPWREPGSIARGPDGNLWFTEGCGDRIGRITPMGSLTEYAVRGAYWLGAITAGPDGNLWFTELDTNVRDDGRGRPVERGYRVGRLTMRGVITTFPLAQPEDAPGDIAPGPDGNIWFTEPHAGSIGRITPDGTVTDHELPHALSPDGIARGLDGNLRFIAAPDDGNGSHPGRIGRITPAGQITWFPVGGNSYPDRIVAGAGGSLWFTRAHGGIGRVSLTGEVTEYKKIQANGIAVGQDGSLWFTEDDRVGHIAPGGLAARFASALSGQ